MDKSILDTIQDSAKGLRDAGVMREVTLREFDALCLPRVKVYTPVQIKRIRLETRTSQAVFAASLNTGIVWVSHAAHQRDRQEHP